MMSVPARDSARAVPPALTVFVPSAGGMCEIQGTAEGTPFSEQELLQLLGLAKAGIGELVALQKAAVS